MGFPGEEVVKYQKDDEFLLRKCCLPAVVLKGSWVGLHPPYSPGHNQRPASIPDKLLWFKIHRKLYFSLQLANRVVQDTFPGSFLLKLDLIASELAVYSCTVSEKAFSCSTSCWPLLSIFLLDRGVWKGQPGVTLVYYQKWSSQSVNIKAILPGTPYCMEGRTQPLAMKREGLHGKMIFLQCMQAKISRFYSTDLNEFFISLSKEIVTKHCLYLGQSILVQVLKYLQTYVNVAME